MDKKKQFEDLFKKEFSEELTNEEPIVFIMACSNKEYAVLILLGYQLALLFPKIWGFY